MKIKLNVVTFVGAILCLASMLFSYVSLDLILISFGIKWVHAAQYTNYVLYAIPVIGVMLMLSSIVEIKPLLWISTAAAIGIAVYYLITYRNILNGDLVLWLNSTNAILRDTVSQYVEVGDLQAAVAYLKPFLRLGTGAWIYLISCLVSLVGVFVDAAMPGTTAKKKSSSAANNSENGYNNGGIGMY